MSTVAHMRASPSSGRIVRALGEPDRPPRIAHCRVDAVAVLIDLFRCARRHVHPVDPAMEDVRDQQVCLSRFEGDSVGTATLLRWVVDVSRRHHLAERRTGAVAFDQAQPVDLVGHDEAAIGKRDAILRANEGAIARKYHRGVERPLRQLHGVARTSITRVIRTPGNDRKAHDTQRNSRNEPEKPIQFHALSPAMLEERRSHKVEAKTEGDRRRRAGVQPLAVWLTDVGHYGIRAGERH